MRNRLAVAVVAALILGVGVGLLLHVLLPPQGRAGWIEALSIVTELFLRLIKMVIAPLVLATLTAGIAHINDPAKLGRIGARTIAWFFVASVVALALGSLVVTLLEPGAGAHLAELAPPGASVVQAAPFSLETFVTHLVPTSIFAALADNEILQIVVFSLVAGVSLIAIGRDRAQPLIAGLDALAALMLRMTGYIMWCSPLSVFAALASAVARQGTDILFVYSRFLGGFYLSLALLWALLFAAGFHFCGRRVFALPRYLRAPLILAFSTASSEAALGPTLDALERFGVQPSVAGFVLPLGYSFNLVGSMIYCAFTAIFLIQGYGLAMSVSGEVTMLAMLLVMSKGIAGVPRAGFVVLAAALPQFGVPEVGVLAVLGIDHFLDMGRTATNVLGNAIAAASVERLARPQV